MRHCFELSQPMSQFKGKIITVVSLLVVTVTVDFTFFITAYFEITKYTPMFVFNKFACKVFKPSCCSLSIQDETRIDFEKDNAWDEFKREEKL